MRNEQLREILREELSVNTVPKLFDSSATAEILGISRGTLNNWRIVGRGPKPTNIGGAIRYQLAEINAWIRQNTQHGGSS